MEFVDKFGNNVKCSVSEYRELTQEPRLVLNNSITVTSSKPVRHYKKKVVVPVIKHRRSGGTVKRMNFIHNRINVLRKNNHSLSYADAFQKANKKWNQKHSKSQFGGGF
jgi:ribosomal protein S2